MENDTSEMFNTEALSFDSTLDSLMDVDYIPDEKSLPFSPPTFSAPSEVLMSAQNNFRADLGHIDGGAAKTSDGRTSLELVLGKEDSETMTVAKDDVNECMDTEMNVDEHSNHKVTQNKDSAKEEDETIQINIEIKERIEDESNLREPSPNFNEIKAKRKKNLERKIPKPNNDDSCRKDSDVENKVRKCPLKFINTNTQSDLMEKENEETVKEPPHKKMRISSKEPNNCEKSEDIQIDQCKNASDKDGKVITFVDEQKSGSMETTKVESTHKEVSMSDKETVESKTEVMASNNVSEAERKVCTGKGSDKLIEINMEKADSPIETGDIQKRIEQPNEQITDGVQEKESENKIAEGTPVNYATESENEIEDFDNESNVLDFEEDNCKESNDEDENDEDENIDDDDDEVEKVEDPGEDEYDDFDEEEEDDVDDDEIHNWLEEGLTKEEIKAKKKADLKDGEFIANEKFILEEKGINPFEVLPAGWIVISHNCGMPVYLHKESRVCTFARPYNIGAGSSRGHEIPLSAIPCLQYRRQLEKEKIEEKEAAEKMSNGVIKDEGGETSEKEIMPKPVIKRADDADKIITLAPKELNKYCNGLFNFRTVTVKKFKTWREKRAHLVEERKKKIANMPTLAPDTKLITCPIPPEFLTKKSRKKEFVLNPEGKTAVSILHEYTQNVLRVQPTYEFKEMSNADLPFKAIVCLNGMQYGSGVATGKRQAKNEGAKATLEILVPELAELWSEKNPVSKQKNELSSDIKFFEQVAIEDPRVPELCVKSSLPQPYQVLHTCLQRNYGLGDTTFKVEKKMITNQKTEFTLSVGKRTCTVVCKNKREAKQKAAQSMLQQLHPLLKNWASILRLYSKNTEVGFEEQKDEFPEQIIQQEKKKNFEILGQLKGAMRKVREQRRNFVDGSQVSSSGQTPATLDL